MCCFTAKHSSLRGNSKVLVESLNSDGEQLHQCKQNELSPQQQSLLTSTTITSHLNNNHLSPQQQSPLTSTTFTSDLNNNHLSPQQQSPLTSTH
jgi:hypothetical protein